VIIIAVKYKRYDWPMNIAALIKTLHMEFGQNISGDVSTRVLDLTSEVGELSKEVLKATHYGIKTFLPTQHFTEELGDVFIALAIVALKSEVNLEDAINSSLHKMQQRLKASGQLGSQ
jgi:NTP pyrophosphatase (non-canonical NTP hydrolase)